MKTVHERADVVPLLAEVFRALGYEGASLRQITERTGIGKGSLYHFFPGGKEEMAAAVLGDVHRWFVSNLYEPLRRDDAAAAIAAMWTNVVGYFQSGRRVCLVGTFALDATRDRFAAAIADYFRQWIAALAQALQRLGYPAAEAAQQAEEIVLSIQGAIVLSRALGDPAVFRRAIDTMEKRVVSMEKGPDGKSGPLSR